MGNKTTKKTPKPEKKATSKKAPEEVTELEIAETPQANKLGFKFYALAVWQMLKNWVRTHKLKSIGLAIILLLIVGGLFIVFRPGQQPLTHDEIVIQVNKELSIKGDGNPVVLTVEDKNKATQPFLQQAENGDKVLLYYKATRAILYRPSEKRIVHQGAYTPPDAKIFIRKGTTNEEAVEAIKGRLNEIEDISLTSEDTSTKSDYTGTIVVNITDRYDDKAQELATALNTEVVRLPAGETFPDADILVIVGN